MAANGPKGSSAQVIIPHRQDVKIESVVVSLNHLTVFERVNGLQARLQLASRGCAYQGHCASTPA